jgi:hypothetical protein
MIETTRECEMVGGPADGHRCQVSDACDSFGIPIVLGGGRFAQATYHRREEQRTRFYWVSTRYPE